MKKVIPRHLIISITNDWLLAYKKGRVYLLDKQTYSIKCKAALHNQNRCFFFAYSSLLSRLLRIGIRTVLNIDKKNFLIYLNGKIIELNIKNESFRFSEGYLLNNTRPLNFTTISSIESFDDMIVWGDYKNSTTKNVIHIYKRTDVDKWEVVYTFPLGVVGHIHNMIPDTINNCVWIMTGDFGKAAAIWMAKSNFKEVNYIVGNDQIYRGCVGFPVNGGLLYATDAPYAQNSIRILVNENGKWVSKHIFDIDGSCIYGCRVNEKYVFSTAVEPDGRSNSIWNLTFGRKRGKGIKDNYCHVYAGNLENGFNEVYKVKKDIYPFIFQFGSIQFPEGESNINKLIMNHFATSKHDLSSVIIDL